MGNDGNKDNQPVILKFWPHGVLALLIVVVIGFLVLAFVDPIIPQQFRTLTPSVTETPTPVAFLETGEEAQIQETPYPLSKEEIGSTDGIIVWSTILILILLVGTLRETLYRTGQ